MTTVTSIQELLFPYQKEDVERLYTEIPRGIIGSDMGTGKTEEFLALCDRLGAQHVLVAAPKTMVLEWRDRIYKRLGEEAAIPNGLESGKYARYSLDMDHFRSRFLVINHEMLRMERYVKVLELVPWDIIGIDEAHRFKNHKARHPSQKRKRGQNGSLQVWGARQLAYKAERFYHITGTPFVNYPDELWSLLHMLYPKEYNNYYEFVHEYCVTVPTPWGPKVVGPKQENLPKLREKLHSLMVRREKSEVMPWLVKLPPRDIPLQMDPKQLDVYSRMEEEFVVELRNGADLFARSSLAQLMRLRQLALEPNILDVAAPSAKTSALLDMLSDINQKVVIFSWFSSYLNYLYDLLNKTPRAIVTGEQKPGERFEAIKRFQEGDAKIMLASIDAGGVGIDLTSASVCIFTDVFWTPGRNTQAEDRLHRHGQENPVSVIRLVLPNTIDEDMHKVLKRKDKAFREVVAIQEAVESMMRRHE